MKAARLYEYDPAMNVQLKIENVKAPTIMGPTDVIVKVGAAGLCRTDLHIIGLQNRASLTAPIVV